MQLYPVGVVKQWNEKADYPGNTMQIHIHDEFSAGLKGVENCEHLWILFWMHKLSEEDREKLQVHPRGDVTKEKRGVFALRSPMRPNPIGLTRVRLIKRDRNILIVEGLDAFDESPVIDIKPG
ncbi:TPA: tRNA (N6-threonylcarbamoyladenosine(37)-N6)-methyltransferase TrmO [Candidatus Poribacteria bacterium]|nr:tRNA (N6-threonylcarbamoyladenosine(37)-N6)-methyltransferase TrmO [Candidatus Poribacteria bacterium]